VLLKTSPHEPLPCPSCSPPSHLNILDLLHYIFIWQWFLLTTHNSLLQHSRSRQAFHLHILLRFDVSSSRVRLLPSTPIISKHLRSCVHALRFPTILNTYFDGQSPFHLCFLIHDTNDLTVHPSLPRCFTPLSNTSSGLRSTVQPLLPLLLYSLRPATRDLSLVMV